MLGSLTTASLSGASSSGESIERTIRLRRGGTIRVELQLDGKPFHVPGASIDPTPVGHGEDTSWSASGGRSGLQATTFDGVAEGAYEVTLTGTTGFGPLPAQTVTVVAGKTHSVIIDLRRLR